MLTFFTLGWHTACCQSGLLNFSENGIVIGSPAPTPHSSAVLELNSSNQGLLIPRLSYSQLTSISSPAVGLLAYVPDSSGLYYFTNTTSTPAWQKLGVETWRKVAGTDLVQTIENSRFVMGPMVNTPEGYRLYVNGGILATSMRVAIANSSKWADYVFQPEYPILPLKEVEKFIQKNGHLPRVPSAETVAKEGVDVAEMQARLLEKIEELTLYIIQQEKRIELLEGKLTAAGND